MGTDSTPSKASHSTYKSCLLIVHQLLSSHSESKHTINSKYFHLFGQNQRLISKSKWSMLQLSTVGPEGTPPACGISSMQCRRKSQVKYNFYLLDRFF